MPITTASDAARSLYIQAQDKGENLELMVARQLADQAIAEDPSFAMAYLLRAQTGGGFNAFNENLNKAVSLIDDVSPGERLWITAEKALADGDTVTAAKSFTELESMFPDDKHIQLRLARYYRGTMRDVREAAVHYRKATTIDPSFAAAYNELGYAQVALGDITGAETSFKTYISLLPDRPNPYDSYGEMLMKVGSYDDSIAQYRKALERDKTFASSLAGIGMNQLFKKNYRAARETFEQQRAISPDLDNQLDALQNVAMSYIAEGQTTEAVRVFDDIAAEAEGAGLVPRAVNAHLDAAFVLGEAGKGKAATQEVAMADMALEAATLPAPVQDRLRTATILARAESFAAQGRFTQAEAEVAGAQLAIDRRQNPNEIRNLNAALGTIALRQKRYKDAQAYFEKSDRENPFVMYQIAVASAGLGQAREASVLFAKVASFNAIDLGYTVVRARAMDKAASAVVATSGKRLP
jgi:tetratricopeptide (TPR) repeat protein